MPLFEHRMSLSLYTNHYVYCGDRIEWDNLIRESCKRNETYLLDSNAVYSRYPTEVRVVKSMVTAKRIFNGTPLEKASIFVVLDNKEFKPCRITGKERVKKMFYYAPNKTAISEWMLNYVIKYSRKDIKYLCKYN